MMMNLYPIDKTNDLITLKLAELHFPCIPISSSWFQHLTPKEALVLGCILMEYQPVVIQSFDEGMTTYKKYSGDRPRFYPTTIGRVLNFSHKVIIKTFESLEEKGLIILDKQKQGYFIEINLDAVLSLSFGRMPLPIPEPKTKTKAKNQSSTKSTEAKKVLEALESITPRQPTRSTMPIIYKLLKEGVSAEDMVNCANYMATTEWVKRGPVPITIHVVNKQLGSWIKAGRPESAMIHRQNLETNVNGRESDPLMDW